MIELTRLNGNRMAVNCDLILCAESAPDTLLTMVTGEKLIVMESLEELVERVAAYRVRTLAEASLMTPGDLALGAAVARGRAASRDGIEVENSTRRRLRPKRRRL